jgi:uncharacterized protein (DUF952 family)
MAESAGVILHLAAPAAWATALARGVYEAESLASEGFIHCSTPEQIIRVANARFRHRRDLVLLQIDATRIQAPIRFENLEGGTDLFPHVYGPLPVSAVVRATPFPARDDGGFDDDQLVAACSEGDAG